jgi:hypothetical protein
MNKCGTSFKARNWLETRGRDISAAQQLKSGGEGVSFCSRSCRRVLKDIDWNMATIARFENLIRFDEHKFPLA